MERCIFICFVTEVSFATLTQCAHFKLCLVSVCVNVDERWTQEFVRKVAARCFFIDLIVMSVNARKDFCLFSFFFNFKLTNLLFYLKNKEPSMSDKCQGRL